MDKESVLKTWYRVQREIQEYWTTSSCPSSTNFKGDQPTQLNDYVYEVYKPEGRPSIELVFFHGLQLEGFKEAHLATWLTADGSEIWLKWISEDHPQARILLVSYDAFTRRTEEQGNMDMFLTSENLVQDLTGAEVQVGNDGCPVVLVGHCIGGLVMKELCIALHSSVGRLQSYNPDNGKQNLLLNLRGFFFYASPNHGSKLADDSEEQAKGLLFQEMTTLNKLAQRRNEAFRKLRGEHTKWTTYGIAEGCRTKLGEQSIFIVPEASARADVDDFYTNTKADHFTICRPASKIASSFLKLRGFIGQVLREDEQWHSPQIDSAGTFGIEEQVNIVVQKLKGADRLALVGMPGIGKSTLVQAVFSNIRSNFQYICFLNDVKQIMVNRNDPSYLQGEIIKRLYYKGYKVHQSFRWDSITRKKALLVLDDVDHRSQVPESIYSGLLPGSHVVVTSQDKVFFNGKDFQFHEVQLLHPEDAKRVFCDHAFKLADPPSCYEDVAAKIIEKCDGLPLALVVMGGYLFEEEEIEVWNDVLKRFRTAENPDGTNKDGLFPIMKMSYNSLSLQEKEMFLDVAVCFNDKDLEPVKQAWRHCGWADAMDSGLKNLERKGLVTIEKASETSRYSIQDTGDCIRMHEVLRDLGKSIALRDGGNVGTPSRVCYNASNPLPTPWRFKEEMSTVKLLMISSPTSEEMAYPEIKIQELRGLKELRILWLDGVSLSGPCDLLPRKLSYMRISYSSKFETLQNTLRQLRAVPRIKIWHHEWKALLGFAGKLWALKEWVISNTHYYPTICQQIEFLDSLDSSGLFQRVENVDIYQGEDMGYIYQGAAGPGHANVFVRYPEHQPNEERGTFWLEEKEGNDMGYSYPEHQPNQERGTFWLEEEEDLGTKMLRSYPAKSLHLFLEDSTKLQTLLHFLERRLGISESHISMFDSEQQHYRQGEIDGRHKDGVVRVFTKDPTKLRSFLVSLYRYRAMHSRILVANIPSEFEVPPDILQQFREVLGALRDGIRSSVDSSDTVWGLRALHGGDIHSGQTSDGNCARQLLTVRCSRRSSPSSASPSQMYSQEMIGTHSFRQQIGDCFVKMPQESECQIMSTRVERSISILLRRHRPGGFGIGRDELLPEWLREDPHEFDAWMPAEVSVDTTLSCCVVSDHNRKKIQIAFLQIGSERKSETNNFWEVFSPNLKASVRTSVYAYIYNSQDREREQIVLHLHGEYHASKMRTDGTEDHVWLERSGICLEDSQPGSTTLELRCDVGYTNCTSGAGDDIHSLLFTEHGPVTLEGELPDYFNAALPINFDLRYQLEFSTYTEGETQVVDFDCVFQFKTKEIPSNDS
ncbi:unnamed protein product [Calypogeia fissa]